MKTQIHTVKRLRKVFSAVCGAVVASAFGIPTAIAQLNPSPGIFNEPPYNQRPRPSEPAPVAPSPIPAPLPTPITSVNTETGTVDVRMTNATGAVIRYQAIGDTQFRTLEGNAEVTLQGLSIPTTLTFRREDRGLLQVNVATDEATGMLMMTLDATEDFSLDRTTLTIDRNGGVFLN